MIIRCFEDSIDDDIYRSPKIYLLIYKYRYLNAIYLNLFYKTIDENFMEWQQLGIEKNLKNMYKYNDESKI